MPSKKTERAVLVTTQHRGVFFGYTSDPDDAPVIHLRAARVVTKWSAKCRGFMGLATIGPVEDSRVSPPADMFAARDITAVALCTDAAVAAWEAAPWR